MGVRTWIEGWPAYRQATGADRLGRGAAAKSGATSALTARTASADKVVKSVCPYCAVGCGQDVYVKDDRVVQIEGDPDSPMSRGRLCPKGSASLQLTTGSARAVPGALPAARTAPSGRRSPLDTAMDMIADRVIATRRDGWQWDADGKRVRRTLGFASRWAARRSTTRRTT